MRNPPKYQRGFIQYVAAALTAVGAVKSSNASKKARRAQEDYNEAQRKINKLKNQQAKRAYLRNFRQVQADTYTAAIATGVGLDSSAIQGTRSSHVSQRDTGLREFTRMDTLGGEMTTAMNNISRFNYEAQKWTAISNFASQFIGFSSGGGNAPTTGAATGTAGAINTSGATKPSVGKPGG